MTESQSLVERLAGEAASSAHLPAAITAHPAFKAFRREFAKLVADHCALTVEVMFAGQGCPTRAEMEAAAKNVADGIRQRFGVGE